MQKIIRINTKTHSIQTSPLEAPYLGLGGRSLIAQFLTDEVNPETDPLGDDAKIIFTTGVFAGSGLATSNRLSVGAKSPLTGGIKESNVGGSAAAAFASHNISSLIIEGKPEESTNMKMIVIDSSGNVRLEDATEYEGMNTYDFSEKMLDKYGDKSSIISIGIAGERLYKNSAIQVTEFSTNIPCRAAGRGGLGSVLGSKKIKGIIIEKAESKPNLEYINQRFKEVRKELNQALVATSKTSAYTQVGTAGTIDAVGPAGIMPTRNFRGDISYQLDKLKSNEFLSFIRKNGGGNQHPCQAGCLVKCSNIVNDDDGNILTAGFEYETIALCGPNCDIYDYEAIAKIDRLCDEMGLDTMETGATMGVCMEVGLIQWGDSEGVLNLLNQIAKGTELGNVLGQGTDVAGEYLGCNRIPTCKHQAISGYDPRGSIGTGVTYATGTMGADHTSGITLGPDDPTDIKAAIATSQTMQHVFVIADSTVCLMAMGTLAAHLDKMAELYNIKYSTQINANDLFAMANQTLTLEKEFNKQAGWKPEDNIMPEFFRNEPLPSTGRVFDVPQELLSNPELAMEQA